MQDLIYETILFCSIVGGWECTFFFSLHKCSLLEV